MQREADSVLDLAGGHFVIANQAGKDWQPGSIGRSPRPRPLFAILEVPDRCRVRVPAAITIRIGTGEFIEEAVAVVDHQRVPVTGTRIGVALNRAYAGIGMGPGSLSSP